MIRLKNHNLTVATRNKLGGTFESVKKSTGDLFAQMSGFKKDKENKETGMLKKKKMVYAYLKAWYFFILVWKD